MATIYQNMDLGVLEIRIGEALEKCTIWGDLNLSKEEYDILNDKILEYLSRSKNRYSGYISLSRMYPKIAATQIINFALFEYDGSHFWTPWSESLGFKLDPVDQSYIGKMILSTMKNNGFDRWEDDGLKYITPIICQAGIPTPSYDEIFDILEGTLNDFYFSPADLLSEINSGIFYHIEKGPERFFRLYPEKSVDLLNSVRVLLQTLEDPTISLERAISAYTDLPPRIIERYLNWLNEDAYSTSTRRSKIHYMPPRLCFSDEGKGVSIYLPEEIIRDEYIYKVCWKIYCDNNEELSYSKTQQVLMSDRSSYIDPVYVAVDLANEYRIELWGDNDDAHPIYNWLIDGFANKDYLLFDNNGRIAKSDSLSFVGSSTVILSPKAKIIESKDISLYQINLPKGWSKLESFTVVPLEKDGFLTIRSTVKSYRLTVKYSYDITLISMGNLFREEYQEKSLPVYTRWPVLQIGSKEERLEDIENWEVKLRSIYTGEQVTYHNRDFANTEEGYFNIETVATSLEAATSGKYEIKVYRGREFKKSFLFYKAPLIESNDSIKMEWPSKFSNVETTGFQFLDNRDDYEIEFKTNVKTEKIIDYGKTWNRITTYEPGTKIEGVLYVKEAHVIEIPFHKTVRKMKWSFWNEANNEEIQCRGTKAFSFNDLQNGTWWLSLHVSGTVAPGSIMELVLQTRNRLPLQKIDIKLNDSGNFSIPMGSFQSTIENFCSTSLSIMFHFIDGEEENEDRNERWISLSEIRDEAILKNLSYQATAAGKPAIIWDETDRVDSESLQLISLTDPGYISVENLKDLKRTNSHRQYILLAKPLPPGAYLVKPYEDEEHFLIDISDDQYSVFDYNLQKLIKIDINTFALNRAITLLDWMILIVVHMGNFNNISLIERKITTSKILTEGDIEKAGKIIFSLIINIKKDVFTQDIKEKLNSILDSILQSYIGNKERGKLIQVLLKCRMSQEDKETVIERIGLYRFSAVKGMLNVKEIRDLWDLDRFIAALWIMKTASVDNSNVDRLVNLIGIDFFKEATILISNNSVEVDWLQSLKIALTEPDANISIRIQNSRDIWGNTQELIDMIDFGNRPGSKIVLDTKKRNTKGKLFAGSRYLDLLIEWYRDTAFNDEVNFEIRTIAKQAEIIEKTLSDHKDIEKIYVEFGRILDNRKANEAPRYKICYYCALFALIESFLTDSEDYNELSISLNILAKKVSELIPAIYERDLLMAELYAFLIKERGTSLCQ